jgi:integrase/recombinase XerD
MYDRRQMLTLYRRHGAECPKRSDRYWKRCACAMWVEGITHRGHYIRRSLKTSSWERAQAKAAELDADPCKAKSQPVTIEQGIAEYLADAKARGLAAGSLRHFRYVYQNGFQKWFANHGLKYVHEIDSKALRAMRESWNHASRTRHTKQVRLKQFFRFCIRNRWIDHNPVEELSRIRVTQNQTDYFKPEEFETLLNAAAKYDPLNGHRGGRRLHALVQLMRWSGLRITDAVTLERSRINAAGELFLHQTKTGAPVWMPLPIHVIDALRYIPPGVAPDPRYFFWSGNGDKNAAADVMHKAFRKVAKSANLGKRCHPHMLRDTFAIEMLLAGVPLDQVSILLGHSSVTMTEKHYAPWVKARQAQLAESVRKAWG